MPVVARGCCQLIHPSKCLLRRLEQTSTKERGHLTAVASPKAWLVCRRPLAGSISSGCSCRAWQVQVRESGISNRESRISLLGLVAGQNFQWSQVPDWRVRMQRFGWRLATGSPQDIPEASIAKACSELQWGTGPRVHLSPSRNSDTTPRTAMAWLGYKCQPVSLLSTWPLPWSQLQFPCFDLPREYVQPLTVRCSQSVKNAPSSCAALLSILQQQHLASWIPGYSLFCRQLQIWRKPQAGEHPHNRSINRDCLSASASLQARQVVEFVSPSRLLHHFDTGPDGMGLPPREGEYLRRVSNGTPAEQSGTPRGDRGHDVPLCCSTQA